MKENVLQFMHESVADVQLLRRNVISKIGDVFGVLEGKVSESVQIMKERLVRAHENEEKMLEDAFARQWKERQAGDGRALTLLPLQTVSAHDRDELLMECKNMKSALKGVLEALVTLQILPRAAGDSILQIAVKPAEAIFNSFTVDVQGVHTNGIVNVTAAVYGIVSAQAGIIATKLSTTLEELGIVQKELTSESVRRREIEGALEELKRSYDMHIVGNGHSTAAAAADDEDRKILAELEKLELTAQLKAMNSKIEEMQRSHAAELRRMELAASENEAALRVALEAKATSSTMQERASAQELQQLLRSEQTRRQHAEQSLAAADAKQKTNIEELEARNLALQQRAEKAELSLSKLLMQSSY